MAKLSVIKRQKKRLALVEQYFQIRKDLKNKFRSATSFQSKLDVQSEIQQLPRDSAKVRLRNRCWKTGRGRGVFRDFGLCRHFIRSQANEGLLPGVIKSSW